MHNSDEIQRLCSEARLLRSRASAVVEVVALGIYRFRSLQAARQEILTEMRKFTLSLEEAAASVPRMSEKTGTRFR